MPSSRKSRRHAKLGSNADSQSFQVGAAGNDVVRRRTIRQVPRVITEISKTMIERLDELPEAEFIPFSNKEATRLQSVKGNGVAILAKQINVALQKRRPKEKVVAYNAGATKIRAMGKTRNPVRHKKRAKDGYLDVLELDSLRRVRVRN